MCSTQAGASPKLGGWSSRSQCQWWYYEQECIVLKHASWKHPHIPFRLIRRGLAEYFSLVLHPAAECGGAPFTPYSVKALANVRVSVYPFQGGFPSITNGIAANEAIAVGRYWPLPLSRYHDSCTVSTRTHPGVSLHI